MFHFTPLQGARVSCYNSADVPLVFNFFELLCGSNAIYLDQRKREYITHKHAPNFQPDATGLIVVAGAVKRGIPIIPITSSLLLAFRVLAISLLLLLSLSSRSLRLSLFPFLII